MTDFSSYTISQLASFLHAEFTHLGVRAGQMQDDERMTEAREAIDALRGKAEVVGFAGRLKERQRLPEFMAETEQGYQEMVRRRAEVNARDPGLVP